MQNIGLQFSLHTRLGIELAGPPLRFDHEAHPLLLLHGGAATAAQRGYVRTYSSHDRSPQQAAHNHCTTARVSQAAKLSVQSTRQYTGEVGSWHRAGVRATHARER